MSRTDLISDLLTLIRNANMVKMDRIDAPASKINKEILNILKREGFIQNYKLIDDKKQGILRVYLKYSKDKLKTSAISGLKRVSKPGLRIYGKSRKLPRVLGGIGVAVISTSKGIMTDKECRAANVGGEVLCYVW